MKSNKRTATELLITVPFLIYFLVQLVHHDLWRDELNVYGIADASPSFRSLLWHVNHEGHPLLWYLVVWLGIKVFPSVLVLKVIQGLVGAAIILLTGLAAPFTRLERILLLCSYFILFEYTVMSRMYGVCVLLVMIFLWRRVHRPDSFIWNSVLLAVMANTDTLGLFFSGAFGLEWILSRYRQSADNRAFLKRAVPAAVLYVAGVLLCFFTVRPPADISHLAWRSAGPTPRAGTAAIHLGSVLTEYLELPWIPIRFTVPHPFFGSQYWNPYSIDHQILYAVLLPLILLAYFFTFRRDRDLLATFLLSSIGPALFAAAVYTGNMRNWGITFVAYVAALWLQRFRRPERPRVSTILLTSCAVFGVAFSCLMWTKPFTTAEATTQWLESHQLHDAAIVGTPDTSVAAVAVLMKRSIYFLECRCSDDYMLFSSRRDDYDSSRMPQYTVGAFDALHTSRLILLTTSQLTDSAQSDIEKRGAAVECLAAFTTGEAPEENFWIYAVSRKALG